MGSRFQNVSNEELMRMYQQSSAPSQQPTSTPNPQPTEQKPSKLADVSDDELLALYQGVTPEPSFLSKVGTGLMEGAAAVGEFVDKYTGAPTRAALGEILTDADTYQGKYVEQPKGVPTGSEFLGTNVRDRPVMGEKPLIETIPAAAEAFGRQFGEDPNLAPTGKELAKQKFGLSTREYLPAGQFALSSPSGMVLRGVNLLTKEDLVKPIEEFNVSPAGVGGLVIDVSADPLNVIPVTGIAKLGAKGTGMALRGSAKALRLEKPAKALAESVSAAKDAFGKLVKPKIADDFGELKQIARDNGIDTDILPPEVEFGEGSIITRLEKTKRQGPFGEDLIEKYDEGLNKVRDAFESKVDEIGKGDVPTDLVDAGERLVEDYNKAIDDFFDTQEVTFNKINEDYQNVLEINPDSQKALKGKIGQIKSFAKRRAQRGATSAQRSQAKDLLGTIEALEQNQKFSEYVTFWRDLGDAAFKNKNNLVTNPPDIRKLREMYFDVRETLIDTIRRDLPNGEKVAEQLDWANFQISELLTEKSVLSKILGDPMKAPENIFKQATKDTRVIDALDRTLSPEQMQTVKAAYLKNLLKPGKDGVWSFANLRNEFRRNKPVLERMLEPEEMKQLTDIVRLGDRYGISILNTSRTAEMGGIKKALRDISGAVGESITNDQVRNYLKKVAREGRKTVSPQAGLQIPKQTNYFGPQAIGANEAFGLRLPQQISIQRRNERDR